MTSQKKRGYRYQPTILVGPKAFPEEILRSILNQAREYGWRVLDLVVTRGVIPAECNPVGALVERPLEHPHTQWAKDLPCPLVRIGIHPCPHDRQVPAVLLDLAAIGRLAADHFAARNFKHVAFVGNRPISDAKLMYETFLARSEQHGCACHLLEMAGERYDTRAQLYERRVRQMGQWLAKLPKPVGIFTYHDLSAVRILHMCLTHRMKVPDEVAVMGCGNQILRCETAPIELSSIDTGNRFRGQKAVRLLHQLAGGQHIEASPVFVSPVGIVERQSTNVLAVTDPLVARAMRYIWDHLELPVSIDAIAEKAGVSRRTLDRAFYKSLGRSASAERTRKRLERCAELLRTTDMTVEAMTLATGFCSCSYLHSSFRREFGLSPGKFRKQSEN